MIFDLSQATVHQNYNLLIGLVAPRPIAWITSMDLAGKINAAPFKGAGQSLSNMLFVAAKPESRQHSSGPAFRLLCRTSSKLAATSNPAVVPS